MKKRTIRTAMLLTAFVMGLTACGSKASKSQPETTAAATTAAETSVAETTAAETTAAETTAAETTAAETTAEETTAAEVKIEIPDNWDWQTTENNRKGIKADFCLQKYDWTVADNSSTDPVTSMTRTTYKVKTENGVSLTCEVYLYVRENSKAEEDVTPTEGKKFEITEYDQKGIREEGSTYNTYTLACGPYTEDVTMMAKVKVGAGNSSTKDSDDFRETEKAVLSTLKLTDLGTMHTEDEDFFYTDSALLKVPKTVEFGDITGTTREIMSSGFLKEECSFDKDGLRYYFYLDTPDNQARWDGLSKDHTETTFCGNPAWVKFYTDYDGTQQQTHFQHDGVNYFLRIGLTAIKGTDEYYKNVENINLGNLGTVLNGTDAYNALRTAIKEENSTYQQEVLAYAETFWQACLDKTGSAPADGGEAEPKAEETTAAETTAAETTAAETTAAETTAAETTVAETTAAETTAVEATEAETTAAETTAAALTGSTEAAELPEELAGDWYSLIDSPDHSGDDYGFHMEVGEYGAVKMYCYNDVTADGIYYYTYTGTLTADPEEENCYLLELTKQDGKGPDTLKGRYYLLSITEDDLMFTRKEGDPFCTEVKEESMILVRSVG